MKHCFVLIFGLGFSIFSFAQTKTDTIKVWGHCNICKKHIETAAKSAGATNANWNKDTKFLLVSYDASKTSQLAIENKIASAGYDTQDVTAKKEAYEKLDEDCQHDRKPKN